MYGQQHLQYVYVYLDKAKPLGVDVHTYNEGIFNALDIPPFSQFKNYIFFPVINQYHNGYWPANVIREDPVSILGARQWIQNAQANRNRQNA